MPRISRKWIGDPTEFGVVHCISRSVRQPLLCGEDPRTGKNFSHHKRSPRERIAFLVSRFGIELPGFAAVSNHLPVILRNRPDVVARRSNDNGNSGRKTAATPRRTGAFAHQPAHGSTTGNRGQTEKRRRAAPSGDTSHCGASGPGCSRIPCRIPAFRVGWPAPRRHPQNVRRTDAHTDPANGRPATWPNSFNGAGLKQAGKNALISRKPKKFHTFNGAQHPALRICGPSSLIVWIRIVECFG
jgi:hypothetical protein